MILLRAPSHGQAGISAFGYVIWAPCFAQRRRRGLVSMSVYVRMIIAKPPNMSKWRFSLPLRRRSLCRAGSIQPGAIAQLEQMMLTVVESQAGRLGATTQARRGFGPGDYLLGIVCAYGNWLCLRRSWQPDMLPAQNTGEAYCLKPRGSC